MPNALQGLLAPAEMRPTPRNKLMGLLADALTQANQFATKMDPRYENKRENQTLGLLADAVSLGSLAKTAERISYGEPLTNAGKANVPFMKPETADALMMAPLSPRNALAALGMVGGMADNGAMRAATVWHGSPHKFDKFDASKIGTGEGAQAYGHGLYLAESPETAAFYREKLTTDGTLGGYKTANEARQRILLKTADRVQATDPQRAAKLRADAESITPGGALYKVDLPDDAIARMLDWDKPLSQQPKHIRDFFEPVVAPRRALEAQKPSADELAAWGDLAQPQVYDPTGSEALFLLGKGRKEWAGSPEVAKMLRERGIPGIRYLDGGSRGPGRGSSNFVVFPGNESLLSILERNGAPIK